MGCPTVLGIPKAVKTRIFRMACQIPPYLETKYEAPSARGVILYQPALHCIALHCIAFGEFNPQPGLVIMTQKPTRFLTGHAMSSSCGISVVLEVDTYSTVSLEGSICIRDVDCRTSFICHECVLLYER